MSESESQGKYPIVPPNEIRCVWMTAGVVSYQLCDRKLECEQCPLDIALRQRFASQRMPFPRKSSATNDLAIPEIPTGTLYGRKHVWVRAGDPHTVRIGLEPGFASALVSPKAVVLPAIGETVVRNKVCSWIVLEGGTLPIVAPISGKVRMTNAKLAENPHTVCMSPLGSGWLFELTVEAAVLQDSDLMTVAEVAPIFAEDEKKFQNLLMAELSKGGEVVGPTMADGGQALSGLSEILGPAKYFRLVRNIYS
jgi:glycine cleavage system H protein